MINFKKIIDNVKDILFGENIEVKNKLKKSNIPSNILYNNLFKELEEVIEEEEFKIKRLDEMVEKLDLKTDEKKKEIESNNKNLYNYLIYKTAFEPGFSLLFRKEVKEQCKKAMIKNYDLLYKVPVVNLIGVIKNGNYDAFSNDSKIVMNLIQNGVDFIEININEF